MLRSGVFDIAPLAKNGGGVKWRTSWIDFLDFIHAPTQQFKHMLSFDLDDQCRPKQFYGTCLSLYYIYLILADRTDAIRETNPGAK